MMLRPLARTLCRIRLKYLNQINMWGLTCFQVVPKPSWGEKLVKIQSSFVNRKANMAPNGSPQMLKTKHCGSPHSTQTGSEFRIHIR